MPLFRCAAGLRFAMLFAAPATLLASCAAPSLPPLPWQTNGALPDAQQVLHVSAGSYSVQSLDPGNVLDAAGSPAQAQMLSLLYSGLFTFDAGLHPVPALVSRYTVSADGLRYTFHLRPNARFAEGTPLTSADAAFSLNRLLTDCALAAPDWAFASLVDAVKLAQTRCDSYTPPASSPTMTTLLGDALLTPDPATLVVRLAQPDAAFLAKLAEPYGYVVEQSVVSRYGVTWTDHLSDGGGLGTSGMYALRTSSVVSASSHLIYTLMASRYYWGERPRLRTVIFDLREYLTPDQPFIVAATDGLVIGAYPPRQSSAQSGGSALRYVVTPSRRVTALAFNLRLAPTDDLRVRQALALAIDKTALAPIISGRAVSTLVPPGTGDYPTGPIANAHLTGDVARARALWQSYVSDHCGGDAARCPAVTLNDFAYGDPPPLDQALIKQWQAALPGIRITPVVFMGVLIDANDVAHSTAAGDYPWFEDYPDPQDWFLEFAIEPRYTQALAGSDMTVYGHEATVDALVARAEATPDPASRLALYHQAEMTLLNDVVAVPIAQQQDGWGVNRALIGVPANPSPWIAASVWARMYLIAPPSK